MDSINLELLNPYFTHVPVDIVEVIKSIRRINKQIKDTLLAGWPESFGLPTKREAEMIVSNFHELQLHGLGWDEKYCWTIAGNLVARYRRDIGSSTGG